MNLEYLIKQAQTDKIIRLNVAVALVNPDHKILICQRAKDKKYLPNIWHIPGGQVEGNEYIEIGAIRQMKAELELVIDEKIYDTTVAHNYIGHADKKCRTVFVLAKASGKIKLNFENQAFTFISINEIENYFEPDVVKINIQVFNETMKLIQKMGVNNTISDIS